MVQNREIIILSKRIADKNPQQQGKNAVEKRVLNYGKQN
jgi:hypothetical protein